MGSPIENFFKVYGWESEREPKTIRSDRIIASFVGAEGVENIGIVGIEGFGFGVGGESAAEVSEVRHGAEIKTVDFTNAHILPQMIVP